MGSSLVILMVVLAMLALAARRQNQGTSAAESNHAASAGSADIDVDLTQLSGTMVYSEAYNMMTNPSGCIDKTVKISGQFAVYTNSDQSQYYTAVIIADATARCQQGMEFVWDSRTYPEDSPELNTEGHCDRCV